VTGATDFTPAVEIARLIRERAISAVEVVDQALSRIEHANGHLHAYLTVCAEQARRQAQEAERTLKDGEPAGPLHGVPFSVKDLECTAGTRTTFGSPMYADHVPDEDSIGVERLRAAGAILVGKTNTPEFGLLGETRNLLGDDARNPWDLTRTTAGSSGGAAASAAAGLTALNVGSDGAGSIAAPSGMCGAVGVKPSTGRIPAWPVPSSSRLFVASGPITRTVDDAQLMLTVMSGHDPRDPISLRHPLPALEEHGRGTPLRVAWTPDLGHFPVDVEVRDACERTTGRLVELGWSVEADRPEIDNPWHAYLPLFWAETWMELGAAVREDASRFHPEVVPEITPGENVTAGDFIRALNELTYFRREVDDFLQRYDVLALPATATAAFPVGEQPTTIGGTTVEPSWMNFMPFPVAWNMGGNPTATVPAGFTPAGLPIGLMFVARAGREDLVLAAARAVELIQPWAHMSPTLPATVVRDEARWE
jgi:Asp-tRNA(Asn)/Glu-tRNA(Gln) amidotransferase A subunit family amidase